MGTQLQSQPSENTNIDAVCLIITQYNYDHVVRSVCFTPSSGSNSIQWIYVCLLILLYFFFQSPEEVDQINY